MRRNERLKQVESNEDGMSLVEILIAVTIMSIISVTLMGYFTSAVDKSAQESRKIIGANLARLKAAELRDVFKTGYGDAIVPLLTSSPKFSGDLSSNGSELMKGRLKATEINGTLYRYLVELDKSYSRWEAADPFRNDSDDYLAQMFVTVYWSGEESIAVPSAKSSTTLDTYLIKRW
ncbi:type II secretion system protein [Paenibacillus qinlingensis]|uniref:Prepilin-type N-terminal cleavage/methylation domain-containing protein n=1 Tax=Paenibacillus qinlingensis TaxID=1837343 RepID=A0ABU1NR93_9BACL|nr:type II secretion system protein [Paenibacillus qinlingensis]MDR6549546.1 prepilin-type N-terminal cleavage/methylation domain-containing protein [Paenibacillus qinlingensis]